MLIDRIKGFLLSNSLAVAALTRMPERCFYGRSYFEVLELQRRYFEEGRRVEVMRVLAGKLCQLVRKSIQHVPYYRETIKVDAQDITESNVYDILLTFPYLEKRTVMDQPEMFRNERYSKLVLSYGTSGGSTGQGIGLWRCKREYDIEKAFLNYELKKIGYSQFKTRIVRIGFEGGCSADAFPCQRLGNRLLVSPYHFSERWIEDIYRAIVDFEPNFIDAYPSCVQYLSRFIVETGKRRIKIDGMILASERVSAEDYRLIKMAFDGVVKVHYGLGERTNFAFAAECAEGDRLHYQINELYGFSENRIDEFGAYEIVGTSYWNEVMPLIRYRTQDYGRIENGIIVNLDGRKQEYLIGKHGERIPGFSIKIDQFTWEYVDTYQVVQDIPGRISIRIAPRKSMPEAFQQVLLNKQLERWGEFFDMAIETVPTISRTRRGKLRLIINNIPSESVSRTTGGGGGHKAEVEH